MVLRLLPCDGFVLEYTYYHIAGSYVECSVDAKQSSQVSSCHLGRKAFNVGDLVVRVSDVLR